MISIETLRRFPFFNGLDEAQLQALAMLADENKADAKELNLRRRVCRKQVLFFGKR